jgi:predicted membrane-bound spermidine synthase
MNAVYRDGDPSRVVVRRRARGLELRVDGTLASWYAPGRATTGSVWDALCAPLVWIPRRRRRRVLILGLGGGSAARLVRALAPEAEIVGVELDRHVVAAARRWLDLDALGVRVVLADARVFLERERAVFDAVLEDVFIGRGRRVHKPPWLPEPGLDLARRRLRRGGVLVSNALDEAPAVERSMRCLFPAAVRIEVEDYDNRIIVGAGEALCARALRRAVRREPLFGESLPRLSFRSLRAAPP